MKIRQAKRMKERERENGRLKKAVAELTLDKWLNDGSCVRQFFNRLILAPVFIIHPQVRWS
jgi:hypothetical protein